MDLTLELTHAIDRLQIPHQDDHRRQPQVATRHAQSIAFLADCGLVPDDKTRRYLDRAGIADGMALALPDVSGPLFQLAVDWTNHNCLLDDAVESGALDVYRVAEVCGRYVDALRGVVTGRGHHPLVDAMVGWRRRALELRVDPAALERFVDRAERMASQFVLERLLARHGAVLDDLEFMRQRVQDGPFDAWFALLDMFIEPPRHPGSATSARLQRLALHMNVTGNELRTCARELHGHGTNNAILRSRDPSAMIERVLQAHNHSASSFLDELHALADPADRAHARALARAVHATHHYELHSVRGCAWAADAEASRRRPSPALTRHDHPLGVLGPHQLVLEAPCSTADALDC